MKQGPFFVDVDLDAIHVYDTLVQDLGLSLIRYFINLNNQTDPSTYVFDDYARRNVQYWLKFKAAAAATGFDMKVVTSILSAPVYMKWNKVDQGSEPDGLDPQYYDELGDHFVSYIRAARDELGLVHYAVSPQNEPYFNEPYSQINYFNDQTYTEMFRVVAPAMKQYDPNMKIFFPEHMGRLDWLTGPTWDRILHDPQLEQYADIGAVHSYIDGIAPDLGSADGWTALYDNVNEHNRPLWMTETANFDGATFENGMDMVHSLFAALKYGKISGWSYLNIAGSGNTDAFMNDGEKTHLYYASKQFFRFARPSMVQVGASSSDDEVRAMAFHQQERDGLGIILVNLGASAKTADIAITGSYTPTSYDAMRYASGVNNAEQPGVSPSSVTLPANSVTSLWAGPPAVGIAGDATTAVRRTNVRAAAAARTATVAHTFDLRGRALPHTTHAAAGLLLHKSTSGQIQTVAPLELVH